MTHTEHAKPLISVCVAAYNGERYIGEQLSSILSQLSDNDELIVSDDGSTDNTLKIVDSLADSRILVVKGPHSHSATLNFECALRHARGEYIFLADQDDVWRADKVSVCMRALEKADCVVSDAVMTDCGLNVVSNSLYASMRVSRSRMGSLFLRNGYTGCCMAFRRRVLDAALPFPANIPMHDIWIGNVAAFFYSVVFINEPLVMFRRHEGVVSCNGKGSRFSAWQKFMFRWNVLKDLFTLWIKRHKNNTRQ